MAGRVATYLRNNVLGLVAIFIALSAGAYAAGLAKNSVKSKHIKDGKVQSVDITDGGLTGVDIADEALTGADIAEVTLQGVPIPDNAIGSAKVADDGLTGADLLESSLSQVPDAGSVDGANANELVRTVHAATTPPGYSADALDTLQTVTVEAPAPGLVTLIGAVTGEFPTQCASFCAMHARLRDDTTDTEVAAVATTLPVNSDDRRDALSPSVTVPVAAGSHTFSLVGSWFNEEATAPSWSAPSLSAIYTRFNGDGTRVRPTTPATGQESGRTTATAPDTP